MARDIRIVESEGVPDDAVPGKNQDRAPSPASVRPQPFSHDVRKRQANRGRLQRAASLAAAARTLAAMGPAEEDFVAACAVLADLGERGALPLNAEQAGRPDPNWTLAAAEVAAVLARLEAAGLVSGGDGRGWELTPEGRRLWVAVRSLT